MFKKVLLVAAICVGAFGCADQSDPTLGDAVRFTVSTPDGVEKTYEIYGTEEARTVATENIQAMYAPSVDGECASPNSVIVENEAGGVAAWDSCGDGSFEPDDYAAMEACVECTPIPCPASSPPGASCQKCKTITCPKIKGTLPPIILAP